VGVAGGRAGGSAADILARADRAMYANKRRLHPPSETETPID